MLNGLWRVLSISGENMTQPEGKIEVFNQCPYSSDNKIEAHKGGALLILNAHSMAGWNQNPGVSSF